MKTRILIACLVIILLDGCTLSAAKQEDADADTLNAFEAELESLRQQMKIPGMSAAVVKDGEIVWARGFGFSDLENNVPATPETPYHLASVTKPFAALVIMQLVQEGKLSLDDPVSRYRVNLPGGDKVLVRHLMSHTSSGTPAQFFQYDGFRYGHGHRRDDVWHRGAPPPCRRTRPPRTRRAPSSPWSLTSRDPFPTRETDPMSYTRVGLDVDGVLAAFYTPYENLFRMITGTDRFPSRAEFDPVPEWNWPRRYGYTDEETERVWQYSRANPDFWLDLRPMPSAFALSRASTSARLISTSSPIGPVRASRRGPSGGCNITSTSATPLC